ncbi:threonine aldolase family protein [Selenihalanaerobacter shriftii]|uniref:L-threonine aldolase n=1 Tax=Selenihalanaerobacter shriftii TaxID=142842 RepID=A0A1T4JJP3_9FIRM|nr:low specificity L-threonine aldolase [Selenihalanaerobacter shriftii]SJZ30338.1 L-threonine aldolase [Selenihalanaerobacter shriftii]
MREILDLRSDTVTQQPQEMRDAMYKTEVGDDILRDDPTVIELENKAAELFGKEAGLLCTSGTMGNQVSVMTFTERGQEIIVGEGTHILNLEVNALSTLSQVYARTIPVENGYFDPKIIEENISTGDIQRAKTGLICLENTYNLNRGFLVTPKNIAEVREVADKYNLPIYMDGARIFNAAMALDIELKELAKDVDALMFCLSKGLSAPIGSVVVGSADFIKRARRFRQRIGGGMRQAGFIAAAGLYGLEEMLPQINKDNENANFLAKKLRKIDKVEVYPKVIATNIVVMDIEETGMDSELFLEKLEKKNIKVKHVAPTQFRLIAHYGIEKEDLKYVVDSIQEVIE